MNWMLATAAHSVRARPEDVFAGLTDHEGLAGLPGVSSARLVRPGSPERNGVGALRELRVHGLRFVEEIVAFEPPKRLGYLVRECSLPLRHRFGEIRLEPAADGGTLATWASELAVPVVGRLVAPLLRRALVRGFVDMLDAIDGRVADRLAKAQPPRSTSS
ncbi:MAG: SRPBCC family protein [Myxococcota bacterium]|nr:SRPBCC family protein [Myxococcales bacterium]